MEERKKMEAVVDAEKVIQKKSSTRKIKESFFQEDLKDLKDIIIFDWILPGIKNAILDALSRMFFNEPLSPRDRRDSRYDRSRNTGRVDYRRYSSRDDDRRDSEKEIDYREIVLLDRPSAERVVRTLQDEIHDRGSATISQLFELVHLPSNYTDCYWGWTRENDISIRRVSEGYLIDVVEARNLR